MKKLNSLLLILLLSSCVNTRFTKRYSQVTHEVVGDSPLVSVSVFAQKPASPAKPAPKVTDFSERGQAAYLNGITDLMEVSMSPADFIKAAFSPIPSVAGQQKDLSTVSKRLVIGTESLMKIPGERIQWLKITLTLSDTASFKSWDQLETKYEKIDVGKIASSSSNTFGVNASLSNSNTLVDTTLDKLSDTKNLARSLAPSVSATRSLTEEVNLAERYINISGFMTDQTLTIVREGTKGIDLQGNILTDVTMKINVPDTQGDFYLKLSNLKDKTGKFKKLDSVNYQLQPIKIAPPNKVNGTLKYQYIYRSFVDPSARYAMTISEHDDKVVMKTGEGVGKINLISKQDFAQIWQVKLNSVSLHYSNEHGKAAINFATVNDAREFLSLLKNKVPAAANTVSIGKELNVMLSSGTPLKGSDIANMKIDVRN